MLFDFQAQATTNLSACLSKPSSTKLYHHDDHDHHS